MLKPFHLLESRYHSQRQLASITRNGQRASRLFAQRRMQSELSASVHMREQCAAWGLFCSKGAFSGTISTN